MMTRYQAMFAAAALLGFAQPALAQNLVVNPGFEDPVLVPGNVMVNSIPGWTGSTSGCCDYGVSYEIAALPAAGGDNWGYNNNLGTRAISQQTAEAAVAGVTYTLSAQFGQRTDNVGYTGRLELWAGGSATGGDVPGGTLVGFVEVVSSSGVFVPASLSYTPLPGDPSIGQLLSVRLTRATPAGQTNYDEVSLTATPPPIPTMTEWAMILLGMSLAAGAALHLHRRRTVKA